MMEIKLNPLQQTCLRAAEQAIEAAEIAAQAHVNRSAGNSRSYVIMAQQLKDGWRHACRAAANRLAEVKGAEAPAFAEDLKLALEAARPKILAPLVRMASRHHAFGNIIEQLLKRLEEQTSAELEATLNDLSLNLADGRHVDRSQSRLISIDNRNGNGLFTFDSPGASQSVGGNMTTTGASIGEIASSLQQLRVAIPNMSLTTEQATELEDLALSAEREAVSEAVDTGRLKRFLNSIFSLAGQTSASRAGSILAQLALLAAGLT